jgi:putative transposase
MGGGKRAKYFVTMNGEARGAAQFCGTGDLDGVGSGLLESARFYHEEGKWFVHLLLVMPDHLHAILSFPRDAKMRETIRSWKKYQTRNLGVSWQDDFYDHRLRDERSCSEKAAYIRANPVRAGLCESAGDWPYILSFGE